MNAATRAQEPDNPEREGYIHFLTAHVRKIMPTCPVVARRVLANVSAQYASAADVLDPLHVLLQRHTAANAAFDVAAADASEAESDRLFDDCSRTMHAIIERLPPATTAAGAIAALDALLAEDDLWQPGYPMTVFARHLLTAARDYIARTQ